MYNRIDKYKSRRRIYRICDYETNVILEKHAKQKIEDFQRASPEIEFKIMKFNFMINNIIGSYNIICEMIKSGMRTNWSKIMYSMLCAINDEIANNNDNNNNNKKTSAASSTSLIEYNETIQIESYVKSMMSHVDIIEKIKSISEEYKNAKRDAILRTRLPCCIMRQIESF